MTPRQPPKKQANPKVLAPRFDDRVCGEMAFAGALVGHMMAGYIAFPKDVGNEGHRIAEMTKHFSAGLEASGYTFIRLRRTSSGQPVSVPSGKAGKR